MVIVSKMNHVYIASTGDFIFPGSNAFSDKIGEKITSEATVAEAIEMGLFSVLKTEVEKEVELAGDETYVEKSAKEILAMKMQDAIKMVTNCLHLEILKKVIDTETRGPVKSAAQKKFDEMLKPAEDKADKI